MQTFNFVAKKSAAKEVRELLPTDVKPTHYSVSLKLDPTKTDFVAEVWISLDVQKQTSVIALNAVDLAITKAVVLVSSQGSAVQMDDAEIPAQISYDKEKERALFTLAEPLAAGTKVGLYLQYKGFVNKKLHGLYWSEYKQPDGSVKRLLSTQLEAPHARRVVPCWDEPAIKATWEVRLLVPKELIALSNMPIAAVKDAEFGIGGEKAPDCHKWMVFEKTPKMSTYLLAFAVGEFECIEGKTKDGTLVRAWTTAGKKEHARFALEMTIHALEVFTEYFGIPYPLPKLDIIAIPNFSMGAMENWGLITFREIYMLVAAGASSQETMQDTAEVDLHEVAHQWFGNYITMVWWTYLWLNEAFATWIAYKMTDKKFPEWQMWTQFVFMHTMRAFRLDGLRSTTPITVPVPRAQDSEEAFGPIAYSKGGSVVRMLEAFLGEELFREGLRLYMKRFPYGNTTATDLWNALEEVSKMPITEMMEAWVNLPGHPIVDVSVRTDTSASGAAKKMLVLRQSRFFYDGAGEDGEASVWPIPLSWKTASGSGKTIFSEPTMEIPLPDDTTWVCVNDAPLGFYRVRYDAASLQLLLGAMRDKQLSAEVRLMLHDDLNALTHWAQPEGCSLEQFLKVAAEYTDEDDYAVWDSLLTNIETARRNFVGSVGQEYSLKTIVLKEVLPTVLAKVGWDAAEGERATTAFLRERVLTLAGCYGHGATRDEAERRFAQLLENPELVSPDLRAAVLCVVASCGDTARYEQMLVYYRRTDFQEDRRRVLVAFAHFPAVSLLKRTLEFALTSEVRSEELSVVFSHVAKNNNGRELAWKFLKAEWSRIVPLTDRSTLGRIISVVLDIQVDMHVLSDAAAFFKEHAADVSGLDNTIKQAYEHIALNSLWVERNADAFAERFAFLQPPSEEKVVV